MADKQKGEKNLRDAPMPPIPYAQKTDETDKGVHGELTVSDALLKLKEMQKTYDEVQQKIEEALKITGWNRKDLESYFSNPSNFDIEEWNRMNKERKSMLSKLMSPEDFKKLEEKEKTAPGRSAFGAQGSKVKRKKLPGQRKNWLPMR